VIRRSFCAVAVQQNPVSLGLSGGILRLAFGVLVLGVYASLASAQRRPMWAVPPSRAISSLTTADSTALVEAGARHVLAPTDAARRCVRGVTDSLGGPVGTAFLREAQRLVAARQAPDSNAFSDHIALLGLRDGDTVTVVLRHDGSGRVPHEVFWENVVDYYFVRDAAARGWRFVSRRLVEARDYVVENPDASRSLCSTAGVR
jgi:hypothetical protein